MAISVIISIDINIVQIYNDEFFGKDLDDLFLEAYLSICQSKKYHLILKVITFSLERRLLFISFGNSYPIICTYRVKLVKR